MKKILLLSIGILLTSVFAAKLDMSKLQCNGQQVYNTTTVGDIMKNCKVYKSFERSHNDSLNLGKKYFDNKKAIYEIQFYPDNSKNLVRCDFESKAKNSTVLGCR